jgi:hypothetical protein
MKEILFAAQGGRGFHTSAASYPIILIMTIINIKFRLSIFIVYGVCTSYVFFSHLLDMAHYNFKQGREVISWSQMIGSLNTTYDSTILCPAM